MSKNILKNDYRNVIMAEKRKVPYWAEALDRHKVLEIGEIYVNENIWRDTEAEVLFKASLILSETYWIKNSLYQNDFDEQRSIGFINLSEVINKFMYSNDKSQIGRAYNDQYDVNIDEAEKKELEEKKRNIDILTGAIFDSGNYGDFNTQDHQTLQKSRMVKQSRDQMIGTLADKIGYNPSLSQQVINLSTPTWEMVQAFYRNFVNVDN
jgi:hypothetical protein